MCFAVGSTPTNTSPDAFEKGKVGINTNITYRVSNLNSHINFILFLMCVNQEIGYEKVQGYQNL